MYSTIVKTRLLPSLSLLLLLLAACAPAAVTQEAPVAQPVAAESTPTAFEPSDTAPAPATDVASAPTEVSAPLPVATSRGDALQATDPGTVNLASGGLQFVEFFRFT